MTTYQRLCILGFLALQLDGSAFADHPCSKESAAFRSASKGCEQVSAGLIWSASLGRIVHKDEALAYCRSLPASKDQPSPWRLPTSGELAALAKDSPQTAFNADLDNYFWSSDEVSVEDTLKPVVVHATEGLKIAGSNSLETAVLCVSEFGRGYAGMKFVRIPKGTFMMGSPSSEQDRFYDEIQHRVTITYDFFMQTTEVTQEQWYNVMRGNPSLFVTDNHCPGQSMLVSGFFGCPENPVERVGWTEVETFIQRLNDKRDGYRYRLPTEAEWEYAARGGSSGAYSVAGHPTEFAWFRDNAQGKTHAVGKLKPNSYGLYDMHGNVLEWTSDWYGPYPNSNSHVTDPLGATSGVGRVVRGGGLGWDAPACRSAKRYIYASGTSGYNVGFRLVRTPITLLSTDL